MTRQKSKKKCIFLVIPVLDVGGQERFVSNLTHILTEIYDVKLILFSDANIGFPIGCEYISLKSIASSGFTSRLINVIRRVMGLKRLIHKYKPVASISFGLGANIVNVLSKTPGTLVATSIRGYASAEACAEKRLIRHLIAKSDRIICVSEGIRKLMIKTYPSKNANIYCMYNAYDLKSIIKDSKKYDATAVFGDSQSKLVSVGTLRPEKGYWHLIKAVAIVKQKLPDVKLVIVGPDYLDNGNKLTKLAVELGISDHVIFAGYQKNPYQYIDMADIYVLSSVREGFPNALVEAMACSKPVIADDCLTGPVEILSDDPEIVVVDEVEGDYGILVPRLDKNENYDALIIDENDKILASAIYSLLSDKEKRNRLGKKAYEGAMRFSYEKCRVNFQKIIEGDK